MKTYKVYELIDLNGLCVDVGYTCRPETRMYQHTKVNSKYPGSGRHYGRTDLKMVIVSEHTTRKQASQKEIQLKIEKGFDPTERINGLRRLKERRKLTFAEAEDIRSKWSSNNYKKQELAKEYNVSGQVIYWIIKNITYVKKF